MGYSIEFAILCNQGKVRLKNQDNFWHNGHYLESENNGYHLPLSGTVENDKNPIFAVFDGMGGEKYGEIAAHIAAKTLNGLYPAVGKSPFAKFLHEICEGMNDEICAYAETNQIGRMGTTAAILAFGKKKVHICNIGDSKIFLRDANSLTQISYDHVIHIPNKNKVMLSQHLGVRKKEFAIEPHFAVGDYNHGDKYLVCSDGLTDMVSEGEIEAILSMHNTVTSAANALMEKALYSGGVDNITIILCEIKKRKLRFENIFSKRKAMK